jgi:hypothetical protein
MTFVFLSAIHNTKEHLVMISRCISQINVTLIKYVDLLVDNLHTNGSINYAVIA